MYIYIARVNSIYYNKSEGQKGCKDLLKEGVTGCSGKIVFFHNSLQPLPRLHRCKRPSKL